MTSTSLNTQQGRSISPQAVTTVKNVTAKKKYGLRVIRNQLAQGNKKATITRWKAGLQHPAVKTYLFTREGLNVRKGLYCYSLPVWGYLVVKCFRRIIWERSLTSKLFLFLLPLRQPFFLRHMHLNYFELQVSSGETKSK